VFAGGVQAVATGLHASEYLPYQEHALALMDQRTKSTAAPRFEEGVEHNVGKT